MGSHTDVDAFLQSPGQLEMLAVAPVRLPTDGQKLAASWQKEHLYDEDHCWFCARQCCLGILCFGIPWVCLPYNLYLRCKTNTSNTSMISRLGRETEVRIDNEAVLVRYKSLERRDVQTVPRCLPLGGILVKEVTGAVDRTFRVPLGSIADVHLGHYREVHKFDPEEGFSWWTGFYSLAESANGPLHLVPTNPELSGPFPDGFTLITKGPITMEEKCAEGEIVGEEDEDLFKLYRINHDLIFLSNFAKAKQAIMLAAELKRAEAQLRRTEALKRFFSASGRLVLEP